MSERVNVVLKMEPELRGLMDACAKVDLRTLSGYVSHLVMEDARVKKITIESVIEKVKAKKAARESSLDVDSVLGVTLPKGVTDEMWKDYVEMRLAIKNPLTVGAAKYLLKKCVKAMENGWDIADRFEEATLKKWLDVCYPQHINTKCPNPVEYVDVDKEEREQREYLAERKEHYLSLYAPDLFTKEVYERFVDCMFEIEQFPPDVQITLRLIPELRKYKRGTEYNDAILQRSIDEKMIYSNNQDYMLRYEDQVENMRSRSK